MIYFSLLAPLLIVFLFIDDLGYNIISDYVSVESWQLARMVPVLAYGILRL